MRTKSLLLGCAALVALVAIAALVLVVRHESDSDTATRSAPALATTTAPTPATGSVSAPSTGGASAPAAAALVALPGVQASTVLDAWSARWKKPVTTDGKWKVISAAYPRPKAELRLVLGQNAAAGAVSGIHCALHGNNLPADRDTLTGLADDCLKPAISAADFGRVRDWLAGEDYRKTSHHKEFAGFTAIVHTAQVGIQLSLIGGPYHPGM
jgi:hypothetical protein